MTLDGRRRMVASSAVIHKQLPKFPLQSRGGPLKYGRLYNCRWFHSRYFGSGADADSDRQKTK